VTLVLAWASVWIAFACAAIARAHGRRRVAEIATRPRVLLVRPCCGAEPSLQANLESAARAVRDLGAGARIVMTVASADDPALEVAARAATTLRSQGISAHAVVARTAAVNRKAGQLAVMADADDDVDVVLVADSDVDLANANLDELVAPLVRGDRPAAATWCAPVELSPRTLADYTSAAILGGSLQAFVLLRGIDEAGLVGKLFAIRIDALRRVGGFSRLRDRLGEDVELARRLRCEGGTIEAARSVASSTASGRTLRAVASRYVRWLVTLRAQRPLRFASYPVLIAGAPLVVVASFLAMPRSIALATTAVVAVARIAVAVAARRLATRPLGPDLALDVLFADAFLLVVWMRAAFVCRVRWRERTLVVRRGGRVIAQADR
jgi:ceramide glucosyltransferase